MRPARIAVPSQFLRRDVKEEVKEEEPIVTPPPRPVAAPQEAPPVGELQQSEEVDEEGIKWNVEPFHRPEGMTLMKRPEYATQPKATVEKKLREKDWMHPEGKWDWFDTERKPPPQEAADENLAVSMVTGFQNLDTNIARLFSSDPGEKEYAIRQLLSDAMWTAGFLGPQYGAALKGVMQSLSDAKKTSPTLFWKAFRKLLPVNQQQPGLIRKSWELMTMPVTWPVKKLTQSRIIPSLPGSRDLGRQSLQELFQPGVERLAEGTAKSFRDADAMRTNVQRLGRNLMFKMKSQKFDFNERREVFEALSKSVAGEDLSTHAKSDRVRDLLKEFYFEFKDLGIVDGYKKHFSVKLEKEFGKRLVAREGINPRMDQLLRETVDEMHGVKDFKQQQKILERKLGSAGLSKDEKVFLYDHYALGANTIKAVDEAGRSAQWKFLVDDLKSKGVVSTVEQPGYVASQINALKRLYVPRDVELELRAMHMIPRIATGVVGKLVSTPMNIWKTTKVIMRPATHFRNIMSNAILNDWGGLPFYRLDRYYDGLKDVRLFLKHGEKTPEMKAWLKLTGGGRTFTSNEVELLGSELKFHLNKAQTDINKSTILEAGQNLFDRVAEVPRSLYDAEEQWFKYTKFKWNLKKGMSEEAAAVDAMKWTFNYGEVTPTVAFTRRLAAPFITFQSKALPLMAQTAMEHPIRFAKWPLAFYGMQSYALDQTGMDEREFDYFNSILPEYVRDGNFLLLPTRDAEGRFQLLNMTYIVPGWGDLFEMTNDPVQWIIGNPMITIAGALWNNTTFSGAPIAYDWESPAVQAAKKMKFVWDQVSVPQLSFNFWEKLHATYSGDSDADTWSQQILSQFGLKIKPIDTVKSARQFNALQNIRRAQAGSWLRKELRTARTPKDRQRLIERHRKNLERINSR